jgi:hypothetical protein
VGGIEVDAEGVADGVEQAAGLGGGLEEGREIRIGGQEVAELAAGAGGGLGILDEPPAAAGWRSSSE